MKQLLFLVFFLSSLSVFAQEPAYTPMRLNYQFRGIKVDSLFLVPSYTDTTQANNYTAKNIPGSLIRTGSDFWMRNGAATAWLQNVNVGPGASPTVQFVDSVWRVAGKDSIFWRKAGVTNKIKDSTGVPYAGDSPDRIDGTATNGVTADMNGNTMRFSDADIFDVAGVNYFKSEADSLYLSGGTIKHITKKDKYEIKDFNNNLFSLDTLGTLRVGLTEEIKFKPEDSTIFYTSKAPMIWYEPNANIQSQIKTGFGVNGIDLSIGPYYILVPGVYVISNADIGNNGIWFPDAILFKGQSITLINTDNQYDELKTNYANNFWDGASNSTLSQIVANQMIVFYSDGQDWYGILY